MARKLIVEIVGDSRSYERALGRSTKASKTFGSSMAASAKNVAKVGAAVGALAIGIGAVATRSFAKFEETLSRSVALAGVSEHEIEAIKDTILELGPETAKGPQELAEAFFFIAGAGLKGKAAVDALTASAKASASGLGETKVVADAVTSAVNAYATTGLTAGRATDILTAAVREGKIEADSLAPAIGEVLPTASALGISFDKVAGAFAIFSKTGTNAAEAATQISSFMSQLLDVSPKVTKALKGVGLSNERLREVARGPGGLVAVFRLLNDAFDGNVEAMREAIPNIRAFRPVMAALAQDSEDVDTVMKKVTESVGDAGHAFEIVSEDEAFKFRRALTQLQVIGIKIGATLAPAAKIAADAASKVLSAVSDIIDKIGEARTVRAKLNVIWEGVRATGEKAQDLLTRAIGAIDWNAVFAGVGGIAEGLTHALHEVDWTGFGRLLGDSFKEAADFVGPALQNLGTTLSHALHDVDWEAVGVAAGPGLITAMLSAFRALLDPGFWARNWQLALSVAIDALGLLFPEVFALRKLGSMMIKPFVRLAAPLARGIASGISSAFSRVGSFLVDQAGRLSERLATALAADLIRLPGVLVGILDKVFGRLFRRVSAWFERLGEVSRFTIRLLGIAAVIRQIERLVHKVSHLFTEMAHMIQDAWGDMWSWLHKRALKEALRIIEPFTHIPGFLGGGTFQNLKKEWQATLTRLETDSETSTANIQANIDKLHGKDVVINIVAPGEGRPAPGPRPRPRPRPTEPKPTPTPEPRDVETPAERAARLKKAAEKAESVFQNTIDALTLDFDKAMAVKRFKAAEDVLKAIRQTILSRIKVVGRTTELARMLWENSEQLRQTTKDANEAQAEAVREAQFKAIGLTAAGEKKLPSGAQLLKRAAGMLEWIKGTSLDTKKNRAQLNKIVNFLKKNFKDAGRDIRQAIIDMLNDIKGAGDETDVKGPITKTAGLNTKRVIQGLGLSPDQARAIRTRLSGFNTARQAIAAGGTRSTPGMFVDDRPIIIHNNLYVDGQKMATNTTRHQQRGARRNPKQKRGPNKRSGI
jgi:TP901 family phage tail tape measure protein